MQVRIGLVVFRDKLPPHSVRLSVRTAGFQSAKRGSIPLQSTISFVVVSHGSQA
jgi:hypothetical protein